MGTQPNARGSDLLTEAQNRLSRDAQRFYQVTVLLIVHRSRAYR